MSELKKLRAKHDKEIQDLQDSCSHPTFHSMSVCVEEGVWGEAEFCKVCGKQLYWIDDPKRTHEVEHIPVDWIR